FRLGGPLLKNKLFYFGTAQWFRGYGSQPATTLTLPTAAGVATLQSIGPNSNVQLLIDSLAGLRAQTVSGTVNIGDRTGCVPCLVEVGPFTRTDNSASLSREW